MEKTTKYSKKITVFMRKASATYCGDGGSTRDPISKLVTVWKNNHGEKERENNDNNFTAFYCLLSTYRLILEWVWCDI